jgi:hypothetical protein
VSAEAVLGVLRAEEPRSIEVVARKLAAYVLAQVVRSAGVNASMSAVVVLLVASADATVLVT